jgi:hypothetical protein
MNLRPRMLRRTLPAIAVTAAVVALAACGGGGSDASASGGTTTTAAAGNATPPDGSRPASGGFGGMQAFTQCLTDQGLDVQEQQPSGQGGPPADGSRPDFGGDGSRPDFPADGSLPGPPDGSLPAPPDGGSLPQPPADGSRPQGRPGGGGANVDPSQMAQFLAQRLGLDTSDPTVAAAIDTCSAQLSAANPTTTTTG